MKQLFFIFSLAIVFLSCNNNSAGDVSDNDAASVNPAPPLISYNILNVYPHDTSAFTEGLLVHQGQLYESTGGQPRENDFKSWLAPVDIKTGRAIKKVMLDTAYFGEGITILNDNIYQLTWKDEIGFIYDAKTLKKLREFTYKGDGWALTNDGKHLIMSDGSSNLQYLDPETLRVLKVVGVQDNNGPVPNINELEYINGYIYANQWLTNYILKIDPSSGKVVGRADFESLGNEIKTKYPNAGEMNGIAFDSASGQVFITGKNWPNLYEIRLN